MSDVSWERQLLETDPLGTVQTLAVDLASRDYQEREFFAEAALDIIGDDPEMFGSAWVALRAMSALILGRKLTVGEQMHGAIQFPAIRAHGRFSSIKYVRQGEIDGLFLDIYDVTLVAEDGDSDKIEPPLLVSPLGVESLIPIARPKS